jgi:hypothetical protein
MVPLICTAKEVGAGFDSGSESSEEDRQKEAAKKSDRDCGGASHMRLLSPFFFSLFSSFLVVLMTDHELL